MFLLKRNNLINFLLIVLIIAATFLMVGSVNAEVSSNDSLNHSLMDSSLNHSLMDSDNEFYLDSSDSNNKLHSLENESDTKILSSGNNLESDNLVLYDSNDGNDLKSDNVVFYVSNDGNDSNSGLSRDDSFLTIEKALDDSSDSLNSIIYISEGVYTGGSWGYSVSSKNIHMIGEGRDKTFLDGEGSHRILYLYSSCNLIIENLTFINGHDDSYGGALYNQGNLTLINCNFLFNEVSSGTSLDNGGSAFGGAIYSSGTLTVENSSFESNRAGGIHNYLGNGGAIYNTGILYVNNSNFFNNTINNHKDWSHIHSCPGWNSLLKGAAIAGFSNNGYVSNSNFSGNSLKYFEICPTEPTIFMCYSAGGAVYFEGDNWTFINSSFTNNTADNGGAVYFKGNDVKFDSCSFENNSAYMGGAIMTIDFSLNSDSYFTFHNLTGNKYSNLTVSNSVFENNFIIDVPRERINFRIGYGAGAGYLKIDNILIYNSTFIKNGLIENNTVHDNLNKDYCHSGAIFMEGQNSTVDNSTFISNKGEVGGAIMDYGFGSQIYNSYFYNNSASLLDGGAIFHSIGDLKVDNCTFDSNKAVNNGGSIQSTYDYDNDYIFEQSSIYNNSRFINSVSEYGGGIFDSGNSVIFENLEFINNSASYGGAVYNQGFSNIFRNSSFINNSAFSRDYSNGGAIYNYGSNVLIELCSFKNNTADLYGGAVFNFGESSLIMNNSFDSNNAFSGGSLYLSGNGGRFSENKISSSSAVYGGALYNVISNLICLNNSFTDCKANVSGGAIYNLPSTLQLYANSMEGCRANLSGVGSGDCVFTCGNISYLHVSFLNSQTVDMLDKNTLLIFANVTDNMGNPISGGNVSFVLLNGSESTVIGESELINGIALIKFTIPLELGSSYSISGFYSFAGEPTTTQIGNLRSVLSSRMKIYSDIENGIVPFLENFSYELILLDSADNYISNAEILLYVDGVYSRSIFTDDVGYFSEKIFNLSDDGKHYYRFIYEGDVFHSRAVSDLNFTVFYNNSYYYDDIVISFTDPIYSFVTSSGGIEIPFEFMISHDGGDALVDVSTSRYFEVYRNGQLLPSVEMNDYLGGPFNGTDLLYNYVMLSGKLSKVYRTIADGIFQMPVMETYPGIYEYTICFKGGLVKHYDPNTHNHLNEEDNYYNPCNISFILIINSAGAKINTQINYTGPDSVTEVDFPSYVFNLTDEHGIPLSNKTIRIYDNGSYVGSSQSDEKGICEFAFPAMLDFGRHNIQFVYGGDDEYLSTYRILELDVLEKPNKERVNFINASTLNLSGSRNSFTVRLSDDNGNYLSDFTFNINLLYDNKIERNITACSDENGSFSIPLDLGCGNYRINCSLKNNKFYKNGFKVFNLTLSKSQTVLLGQSSLEVLKNESYLSVILTTNDFRVLSDEKIIYYAVSDDYNQTYYAFTNESSFSRLKISLPVGRYELLTVFEGDKWCEACSLLTNLTVYGEKSHLEADENIIIRESGFYTVKLLDGSSNPISGESIDIVINGNSHSRITDENGEARLEIDLDYGNYTVTSNFRGNINYTSSTVSSRLYVVDENYRYPSLLRLNSSEIYRVTGYYDVILTGINNEALIHKNIIVSLNGTNYTIRTNNDGIAHLDYGFELGTYTITSCFMGDDDYQSSNITSTMTVVSENAANTVLNSSVYYVLRGEGGLYTVTLLDKIGNPIAGEMIYFTLGDKEYSGLTDSNGDASLLINLIPGSYNVNSVFRGNDVYFASSTFSKLVVLPELNETNETEVNNITNGSGVIENNVNQTVNNSSAVIKKFSTKIVANNLIKYYKDSKKLVISLKDSQNKAVLGRNLSITINGKTYMGATDKKGQIKVLFNLKKGSYAVNIRFSGDRYYKGSSRKITVKVVLPKINAVKTTVKRNKNLQVKFLTYNGKAIRNQKVFFKIKGKTYTVKTNSKGIASLRIKVKIGTYNVNLGLKNTKTYGEYTKTIKIKVK